ncbi:hypothetical protein [Deinococcus arcticus]|uniref:Uncharacterized protein n=1 Tax=Deinococcus arcticus TaxID=2136176 RepID=A0A2T3W4Y4_9DEIO|nr:hypothetical protein [Deinococcus arcticus]PTA66854.1 hypothetical protein C8263_15460 [Deinococcus arcticus]
MTHLGKALAPRGLTVRLLSARRRRLRPFVDLGPFFLFFGISGVDHGREARLERRFEEEYYPHLVTLRPSGSLPPGRYSFAGLPADANRRGWAVEEGGLAQGELSEDGWAALQAWLAQGGGEGAVQPQVLDA